MPEVVVTGSLIKSSDLTSEHPITVVSSAAIERSRATSLTDLLDRLPAFGFQGVNGAQNQTGNGNEFIELRSLGINRTLVLIDGRRTVASGNLDSEAVDIGTIPVSLVDRIEVLRDGASPAYGSDAIAGVVNIILKKNFSGWRFDGEAGSTSHNDGRDGRVSGMYGADLGRGAVTLNIDYLNRSPIKQSNRSWARNPIQSATPNPDGAVALSRGYQFTPAAHVFGTAGPLPDGQDPALGGGDLVIGRGRARPFDPATDNFDFGSQQYLTTGQERESVAGLAHYDLRDDVTAFFEGSYAHRTAENRTAPIALGNQDSIKYPGGFVVPAANPTNFFGQDVLLNRSLREVGDGLNTAESTVFRIVGGLEGRLLERFDWQAFYSLAESQSSIHKRNAVNIGRALQSVGAIACTVPTGCPQGDYFPANGLTPAVVDFIRYNDTDRAGYAQRIFGGSISGPVAALPAGPLGLAIGAEQRRESGRNTPDPVVVAGDSAIDQTQPTSGSYDVTETFAELNIPVLADLAFARQLDVNAGFRYSDYNRFGANTTYKVGFEYSPVADLRLRGNRSTAFRAPAISQAFQGAEVNFLGIQDPCDPGFGQRAPGGVVDANCRAQGAGPGYVQQDAQFGVRQGGNPDLKPETAQEWSAGAVITPRFIPDLSITVDYYKIKIKNAIETLDPTFVLNQCYGSVNLSSSFCADVGRGGGGGLNRLIATYQNIGAIKTDGVDFDVQYGFELAALGAPVDGRLSVDWRSALLLNFDQKNTPNAAPQQLAGTFGPNTGLNGGFTHFRSNLETVFAQDRWSLGYTVRFIGGAKVLGADPNAQAFTKARPVFYHDIVGEFRWNDVTFVVGVDNLDDKTPPIYVDGATDTNTKTYDVAGRFVYFKTSVAF